MKCSSAISPALRVPIDDSIYCYQCDAIQPAYAHIASGKQYCAVCDAAYDPDLIPEDYDPYIPTNYFNEQGIVVRRI